MTRSLTLVGADIDAFRCNHLDIVDAEKAEGPTQIALRSKCSGSPYIVTISDLVALS